MSPTTVDLVTTAELPDDVAKIIEFLAMMAKGYDNRLKWNEEARLKADLMHSKRRWRPDRVSVAAVREKCVSEGMTSEDTTLIVDLIQKAQAGRRLVPQRTYRDFTFPQPYD